MLSFEGSTRKFLYKTAVFAYKAIWGNPPNSFSPSWICDFSVRGRKTELCGKYMKIWIWKKATLSETHDSLKGFCGDLAVQGPQTPLTIKAKMCCFKKVEPILNLD